MSVRADGRASRSGRANSLATAALVCGIIQFFVPPACFAAIILGHVAHRQIRRTGERGYGMATAGLILGYFSVGLALLVAVMALVMNASVPATLH
jgi:hypothetical protein